MKVKDFFTPDEWKNLVDYEKTRISNTYDKYRIMKVLGFDPAPPDFILNYNKRKRDLSTTESSDDDDDGLPTKKSLMNDERELRLSQELEELQVSQDDNDPAVKREISSENDSDQSKELNTLKEVPIEINIRDDNKRVIRSSCKKINDETSAAEKSYSTRTSARNKYYCEYSSPEEDDYEFCDKCNSEYLDACPIHGVLIHIRDTPVNIFKFYVYQVDKTSDQEYARRTIPRCLKVAASAIKNAGLGVWTTTPIPGGSRFGPYKGVILSNPGTGDYAWEIKYREKRLKSRFVDGSDVSNSNWMRYVNSARNFTEQNLVAYQYQKKIYYRVPRDVPANKELYVYYGDKYSRDLGIDTRLFFKPPKTPLQVETFACDICIMSFSSPVQLENHRTSVCGQEPEKTSS